MGTTRIPDAALRFALGRHFLSVESGGVDTDELAQLRRLKWTPRGDEPVIESLDGLQEAECLEELWLEGNDVDDLGPVARLSGLRVLDVARNARLIDLEPLRGHERLRRLMLGRTSVADITPLGDMPALRVVRLWGFDFVEQTDNWAVLLALRGRGVRLLLEPDLDARLDDWIGKAAIADGEHTDVDPVRARLRGWGLHELASGWVADGPQWRDDDGNTLLHRILFADIRDAQRVEAIERLAGAGVDVDALNDAHETALGTAVWEMCSADVATALLDAGAELDFPSERPPVLKTFAHLTDAGRKGFGRVFELLTLLVARGAGLTSPRVFRALVRSGPLDHVRRALDEGADPNHGDIGCTPLMAAAEGDRRDVVELLIDAGADPATTDVRGRNALSGVRTMSLYERFREEGADPTVPSKFAPNALFTMTVADVGLVRRMVEDGASVLARNSRRETVLHVWAATPSRDAAPVIEALIDLGADPCALNSSGETPLDRAHDEEVRAVLERRGAVSGREHVEDLARRLIVDDAVDWDVAWTLADAGQTDRLSQHASRFAREAAGVGGVAARLAEIAGATSRALIGWWAGGPNATGLGVGTLLHLASETRAAGRDELMRLLLDAGADPDRLSPGGVSALRQYFAYGETWDTELVARLASAGTVDAPSWSSPLIVAAQKRYIWTLDGRDPQPVDVIIDQLVEAGARLDRPIVFTALCRSGREDLVGEALDSGVDPHHVTGEHDTPLAASIMGDHVEILSRLLDAGVDPDQGMFETGTPPVHASRTLRTLDLLIDRGASVDACARHGGESAVFAVASRVDLEVSEQLAMIERLEERGQSLFEGNRYGRRPIDWLEERSEPEVQAFVRLRKPGASASDR